jgi:hypothetical protein
MKVHLFKANQSSAGFNSFQLTLTKGEPPKPIESVKNPATGIAYAPSVYGDWKLVGTFEANEISEDGTLALIPHYLSSAGFWSHVNDIYKEYDRQEYRIY